MEGIHLSLEYGILIFLLSFLFIEYLIIYKKVFMEEDSLIDFIFANILNILFSVLFFIMVNTMIFLLDYLVETFIVLLYIILFILFKIVAWDLYKRVNKND